MEIPWHGILCPYGPSDEVRKVKQQLKCDIQYIGCQTRDNIWKKFSRIKSDLPNSPSLGTFHYCMLVKPCSVLEWYSVRNLSKVFNVIMNGVAIA